MRNAVRVWIVAFFTGLLLPFNVTGIQCHSCSGKADCESTITLFPDRSGRCEIDIGKGKCFIRKDPNNVIYWGCIDDEFWPGVPWRTINGCLTDWDRAWEQDGVRNPMIWCFCNRDDCNVSVQKVNSTNWDELDRQQTTTQPPALTTVATTVASTITTTAPTTTANSSPMTPTTTQASKEISPTTSKDVSAVPCPSGFILDPTRAFCHKVVSPTESTRDLSRGYNGASRECLSFNANLVTIDSTEKHSYLASILSKQTKILDGWQGWWTSGQFVSGMNQFSWNPSNKYLPNDSKLWGFQRAPYRDTCVWIMSISAYQYSLANYDCNTKAGYICEIQL